MKTNEKRKTKNEKCKMAPTLALPHEYVGEGLRRG
jgi:hypothetical protein